MMIYYLDDTQINHVFFCRFGIELSFCQEQAYLNRHKLGNLTFVRKQFSPSKQINFASCMLEYVSDVTQAKMREQNKKKERIGSKTRVRLQYHVM